MRAAPGKTREIDAVVQRFLDLPDAAQLDAFFRIRGHLHHGLEALDPADAELQERGDALWAIREAARILNKPAGVWPDSKEFGPIGRQIGWPTSRVVRAWGRWSFAIDALNGGRAGLTPSQREKHGITAGRSSDFEAPLPSVRQWLKTCPPRRRKVDYNAWCDVENEQTGGVGGWKPKAAAIKRQLLISWPEIIGVAEGEIELSAAQASTGPADETWTRGPHDLVGRTTIAQILGVSHISAWTATQRSDFPRPVLNFKKMSAWLREDVAAWRDQRPVPARAADELRQLYMDRHELARRLKIKVDSLKNRHTRKPPPTGAVSRTSYWLKTEVEDWLRRNPPGPQTNLVQRAGLPARP